MRNFTLSIVMKNASFSFFPLSISASIPLALIEVEKSLDPGDKLILCSVGAGVTTAAVSLEW